MAKFISCSNNENKKIIILGNLIQFLLFFFFCFTFSFKLLNGQYIAGAFSKRSRQTSQVAKKQFFLSYLLDANSVKKKIKK